MICSRGGFPSLQSLVFDSLDELERWVAEAGAMPRLRTLKIYGCTRLGMLPQGLQHMAALKDLTLLNMPGGLCSRARPVDGEDRPKIRHVPSMTISERGPSRPYTS